MGPPPKLFAFELFTNSEAPPEMVVGFPGLITLTLLPANVREPPLTPSPLLNVFWPSLAKVTAPLATVITLLKLLPALFVKVRPPAPSFVNDPLAANPPDPPKK